jgi:hypothetical protein
VEVFDPASTRVRHVQMATFGEILGPPEKFYTLNFSRKLFKFSIFVLS